MQVPVEGVREERKGKEGREEKRRVRGEECDGETPVVTETSVA